MYKVPLREVDRVLTSRSIVEGGGVKVNRAFAEDTLLDPFLLLDEFHTRNPRDFEAGFPMHPHRGFETVTYMLEGSITHRDSAGNQGTVYAGGVQWMTAGRGIVHEEMPRADESGRLWGFQLWINLPAAHKMDPPKYFGVTQDQIPEIQLTDQARARIICGSLQGVTGPVRELAVDCQFLDILLQPYGELQLVVPETHKVFAYVLYGVGLFDPRKTSPIESGHTVIYGSGPKVRLQTKNEGLRCLLISGQPIGEPVAWRGSIVMNTSEELDNAYRELQQDSFTRQYPS